MEERRPRCSVQLKLDVVGATNIAGLLDHHHHGCKGSLFARYYLNKKIAHVNTKEVEASTDPQWGETFSLECEGKGVDEMLSKSESVVFEVRWRRRRRGAEIFGGSAKSKVLGRVEVSWEELLSSPTLSLNKWFPIMGKDDDDDLMLSTPALKIAMSVTVAAAETFPRQKISKLCREERRRRLRSLERDECGCGGEVCRADYYNESHSLCQV